MVETIDNSGDLVIFSLAIPIALCWATIRDFAMHADQANMLASYGRCSEKPGTSIYHDQTRWHNLVNFSSPNGWILIIIIDYIKGSSSSTFFYLNFEFFFLYLRASSFLELSLIFLQVFSPFWFFKVRSSTFTGFLFFLLVSLALLGFQGLHCRFFLLLSILQDGQNQWGSRKCWSFFFWGDCFIASP